MRKPAKDKIREDRIHNEAIVDANGLKDPNHIEPGQRLIIPLP